jgi:hypothetical protein
LDKTTVSTSLWVFILEENCSAFQIREKPGCFLTQMVDPAERWWEEKG